MPVPSCRIFNSKRSKLSKDKDLSTTSSANIARRSAPTPGSAAPLSAKAEKARLAQQYGVPEIAVTQPSTMTASEEKRSLERKYAPKIELDVVDQVYIRNNWPSDGVECCPDWRLFTFCWLSYKKSNRNFLSFPEAESDGRRQYASCCHA